MSENKTETHGGLPVNVPMFCSQASLSRDRRQGQNQYSATLHIQEIDQELSVTGNLARLICEHLGANGIPMGIMFWAGYKDTAPVIARLHGELGMANERAAALKDKLDRVIAERDEQINGRADFQQRCADSANKFAGQRDEEKARADNLATALQTANQISARISADLRARAEKAERELAEHRHNYGEAWQASTGLANKVARLESELAAARKERDKARGDLRMTEEIDAARISDLDKERNEALAQVRRFMFGTAHGAKCFLDEHGWHCGEGCRVKDAKQCGDSVEVERARIYKRERDEARHKVESLQVRLTGAKISLDNQRDLCESAVNELKLAREQLGKLEWAGQRRGGQALANGQPPFVAKACPVCAQVEPTEMAAKYFTADQIGHRAGCWFAKGKVPANTQGLREMWNQMRSDCRADAMHYAIGCDFAKSPPWTSDGTIGSAVGMSIEPSESPWRKGW